MNLLGRISLLSKVLPDIVAGRYRGIGSFSGECSEAGGAGETAAEFSGRILLYTVFSYRPIRLLTSRTESELVWRKQTMYMKAHTVDAVNKALSNIFPVDTVPGTENFRTGKWRRELGNNKKPGFRIALFQTNTMFRTTRPG
eukprot:Plantae.Rhodophyta-Palmaria_palmata.ctg32935.p1 GENE.Plantae.Rhodophyta-Palmaria_palmata.ctg32935~~Plantae.Rhodophyta-Palmaria_palmata.ctg32935.p1  ORF type:complete len:142 (+),score=11.59 Plantae.Rhodophyta-Palmaria_palmata.ctg32935:81-506(+)